MITHRIDEAEKICDRIGIIVEGEIREIDHPLNIKEKHGIIYML
jgi:ABC-type multidrug transport system ATPase subunit